MNDFDTMGWRWNFDDLNDLGGLGDLVKLRDLADTARLFTAVPLDRFLTGS